MNSPEMFGIVAAISSVLGHSFPVWLGFKGGKGGHFSRGAFRVGSGSPTLVGIAIWILTFLATRYVSVASIAAAAALPLIILVSTWLSRTTGGYYSTRRFVSAAVVIWRHRSNLSRLMWWDGAALYSKVKIGETAILGAGSWGTALAWFVGQRRRPVSLWGHDGDRAARMRETGRTVTIFRGSSYLDRCVSRPSSVIAPARI